MVYIILEQFGEYEDYQSNPIHAFTTELAAQAHVEFLESRKDFIQRLLNKRKSLKDKWIYRNPLPEITDEDLLSKPRMSPREYETVSSSTLPVDLKIEIHEKHNKRIKEWKNKVSQKWQERMDKEVNQQLIEYFESDIKKFDFDLHEYFTTYNNDLEKSFDIVDIPLD